MKQKMESLIDLSLPIEAGMPVYPGDPPVEVCRFLTHERDGLQATALSISCHAGTHLDVPRHFLPDGATLDRIALDRMTGTAIVAAATWTKDGCIDLGTLDLSGLSAADGLLLATGWDSRAGRPEYYTSIPQFAPGATEVLLAGGFRFFGLDLPTVVEQAEPADSGMMHRNLMQAGMIIIESLCGLQVLVGRRLQFYAFPLRITGSEGSPVRACARLLPEE